MQPSTSRKEIVIVLPGETLQTGAPNTCPDCGEKVELQVCRSHAGHYIGTMCGCGPYSRESGYYPSYESAEQDLKSDNFARR